MKKLLIVASLAATLSLSAFNLPKYGNFEFKKMHDNVYIMHGPVMEPNKENEGFMNNPAIIESKNGLIVVDPGGNYNVGKKIFAEIKKVSKKPVIAIFNTHQHGDHWFAGKAILEKYPKAKSYAYSYMIKRVKEEEAEKWYGILDRLSGNLSGTKPFAFPTVPVEDTQKIVVDGQTFIMHHPKRAHTDTDILVEHVNSKTLFIGDNLMKNRLGGFDDSSSIFGNIELLENIIAHKGGYGEYKLYVPGHGPSGAMHDTLDPFLNYMKILTQGAEKAYKDGVESYEIKPEVVAQMKDYQSWDAFDGQMGKHLMKALSEIEAREASK